MLSDDEQRLLADLFPVVCETAQDQAQKLHAALLGHFL